MPENPGFPLTGSGITRTTTGASSPARVLQRRLAGLALERQSTVLINGTVEVSNPSGGGAPGRAAVRLLFGNRPFPFTAQFTSTIAEGTVLSLAFTAAGEQFDLNPGVHALTLRVQTEGALLHVHQAAFAVAALP